jgi:hypothetical protein
MDMITKINQLKSLTDNAEVKALCESTINAISSAIYNNVSDEARFEIENYSLTNLFEGLERYPKDEVVNKWLKNQKRLYFIKNIGVRKAVNTLLEKEAKYDYTLAAILERFKEQLNNNVPEVLLYEDFISALSSYNVLPACHTELSAVAGQVEKYKE